MGKVKDEAPATKSVKTAAAPSALRDAGRQVGPFLTNLFKTSVYKPNQGWYARLWTSVGLAALVGAGIYRYYQTQIQGGPYSSAMQITIPTVMAAVFAWLIFRVVQYEPFVDFLTATEAEMNKVSWTTKDDLKRATIVVLVSVVLLSVYLFGVDFLWSTLLQKFGVLRFASESFGSQAG